MPKIKDLGIKVIPDTIKPPEVGGGGGCSDCTVQAFSICGGTGCGNVTKVGCTDCTVQAFSICGGTYCGFITHCTFVTHCTITHCGFLTPGCGGSILPCGPLTGGCGAISPVCAGSIIDTTIFQQPGGLSREQITSLRTALQKELAALEEHAKSTGPKTAAEIDAREKALKDELTQLAARRKELKK